MTNTLLPTRALLVSVFVCLALSGCSEFLVNGPDVNHNMDDFSAIGQLVSSRYPFLQFKQINWDSLTASYQPLVVAATGDDIYPVLHNLLGELKDGHVDLITEGGFSTLTYDWPRRHGGKAYSPLVVRKYFDRELRLAGGGKMEYEILPGNIGYVYLSTFTAGDWINDFDAILDYLRETGGLIIDVRNNGGGSSSTSDFVISRFATAPIREVFYFPNGTYNSSFIRPRGSYQFLKPVVVLINGASFSAAELFPELMKQIPTVITLGDTTGGGGGSTQIFHLPSNKRIQLPTMYFKRFDGTMVEWSGIPPDILVPQTSDDIKEGHDKQLDRAIQLLR